MVDFEICQLVLSATVKPVPCDTAPALIGNETRVLEAGGIGNVGVGKAGTLTGAFAASVAAVGEISASWSSSSSAVQTISSSPRSVPLDSRQYSGRMSALAAWRSNG